MKGPNFLKSRLFLRRPVAIGSILWLMGASAWMAQRALANTEELVNGLYSSGHPYMVVLADEEGTSKRAPGVYARDGRQWRQIISGNVLVDDRRGPFIHQLALTKVDDRSQALSVVDGTIYLFHSGSDSNMVNSIVTLGTIMSPLVETLTHQLRYLPKISSVKGISVYQHEAEIDRRGYQLVVVSLLFDTFSPVGDGITFAFAVRVDSTSHDLTLAAKPVVLDYQFHPSEELPHMVVTHDIGGLYLQSPMLGQYLAQVNPKGLSQGHELAVRGWQNALSRGQIRTLVHPLTHEVVVPDWPQKGYRNGSFRVLQKYDLLHDTYEFVVEGGGESSSRKTYPGRIKTFLNSASGDWNLAVYEDVREQFFLLVTEGEESQMFLYPHALEKNGKARGALLEVPWKNLFDLNEVVDFSFYSLGPYYYEKDGDEIHLLLMSFHTELEEGQGQTYLVRLRKFKGSRQLIMEDQFKIADVAYTDEELKMRVYMLDNRQIPIFDNLTPLAREMREYRSQHKKTAPHLTLLESNSLELNYIFAKPQTELTLAKNAVYREYEKADLVEDPSGLYILRATGPGHATLIRGEILRAPGEEDSPSYQLSSLRNLFIEGMGDVNLDLYAVDPDFEKGVNGFELVTVISSVHGSFDPLVSANPISGGFSELLTSELFLGRGKTKGQVYLFYSFKSRFLSGAFTFILDPKVIKFITSHHQIISDIGISPPDLTERIVFDVQGNAHYVVRPGLKVDDLKFEVFNLKAGSSHFPNSSSAQVNGPRFDRSVMGFQSTASLMNWKGANIWRWLGSHVDKEKSTNKTALKAKDPILREMFSEVLELVEELSRPAGEMKRQVLLVPPELQGLLLGYLRAVYVEGQVGDNSHLSYFSSQNNQLNFYAFDDQSSSQDMVFQNFIEMKKDGKTGKNLLMANLAELAMIGRPEPDENSGEDAFVLSVATRAHQVISNDVVDVEREQVEGAGTLPHLLYLFAAEGPMSLEDFRRDTGEASSLTSQLLIGTHEDWEELKAAAKLEIEYGLEERFALTEMELPGFAARYRLLQSVFLRPQIRNLGLKFDAGQIVRLANMLESEHQHKVLEYVVSRTEALARNKEMNPISSFVSVLNVMTHRIFSDPQIRRHRVVDKAFVERVLSEVFDLTLNHSILPPDDYLIMLSRKDAVFKLQEAGYEGPFEMTSTVIETILSQTHHAPVRAIPSSMIVFGDSGTGKTFLFESLMKMLKVKPYDFNAAEHTDANSEAQYIVINMAQVVRSKGDEDDGRHHIMSLKKIFQHINHFLTLPSGMRGFILFDDVHLAEGEILSELLQFIRGLQEAPKGIYTAASPFTGEVVSRPVRHLNLMMTFNPESDIEKIERFAKDKLNPTPEEIALATLSSSKLNVERSTLRRWGAIINLDQFPVQAKGPTLIRDLGTASREVLNYRNQLMMVHADVVEELVSRFPTLDARSFLSGSIKYLMDRLPREHHQDQSVFILVPDRGDEDRLAGRFNSQEAGGEGEIFRFVNSRTRAVEVHRDIEGQLIFLDHLSESIRIPMYKLFLNALLEDHRFVSSPEKQAMFLGPTLLALRDHLEAHRNIPLNQLGLKPLDMGISLALEEKRFFQLVDRISGKKGKSKSPFFPMDFDAVSQPSELYIEFLGSDSDHGTGVNQVTRPDVIRSYRDKVSHEVERYIAEKLAVENLHSFPEPETWVRSLSEEAGKASRRFGKSSRDLYWDYLFEIFSPELAESQEQGIPQMPPYLAARLFFYAMDKSLTDLPWLKINEHLINSLTLLTQDQVLSQNMGVQNYFFSGKESIIQPVLPDVMMQMIENHTSVQVAPQDFQQRMQKSLTECQKYLMNPRGGAGS